MIEIVEQHERMTQMRASVMHESGAQLQNDSFAILSDDHNRFFENAGLELRWDNLL